MTPSKSGKRVEEQMYNGWKNYSSWNVALWIANDYALYLAVVRFMKDYTGDNPYKDFIISRGMESSKTGDLIKWISTKLDYKALNDMMWEYSPIGTRA
jgi:hypothetical protein